MFDPAEAVKQDLVFEQFSGQGYLLDAVALKELNLTSELCDSKPTHFARKSAQPTVGMTLDRRDENFVAQSVAVFSNFDREASPTCNETDFTWNLL